MIHLYKYWTSRKKGPLVTDPYLVFEHPHPYPALWMTWKEIRKIALVFKTKKEAVLAAEAWAARTGQKLALHN